MYINIKESIIEKDELKGFTQSFILSRDIWKGVTINIYACKSDILILYVYPFRIKIDKWQNLCFPQKLGTV